MSAARITLLCVAVVGVALAGECGQFSVGECSLAQENIVDIQDLPCDGIDTDRCVGLCQSICSFTSDCNFFSYNVDLQQCTLMQEPSENAYLSTCDVLAGPDSPTLQYCTDTAPEDSCDRFVAEDCVYLGNVLVNQTSFQSASDCQKFLEEFGDIYRAQFFIHDNVPKHLCQLLDSDRRTCSSVTGPQEPAYEDCVEKNTV